MSGTASDDSGISKVTVNGNVAELNGSNWSYGLTLSINTTHTITIIVTDGAGNTNTVKRYIRVEAFYQYAARISGTTVQSSLANTLTNSTVCTAIANNSTACTIMKNYYKSNITTYNTSNYSSGLNKLAFICNARTYLLKGSTICTEISSWNGLTASGSYVKLPSSSTLYYTTSNINFTGFSKIHCDASVNISNGGNFKFGVCNSSNHLNGDTSGYWINFLDYKSSVYGTGAKTVNHDVSLSGAQGSYRAKVFHYANDIAPLISALYIE